MPSWSQTIFHSDKRIIKFNNMFDAKMYAGFKNEREGYGDYKDPEIVKTEELYVIDGVKVIVTDRYVQYKEAQLDRKAKREANDPRRMKYMEECISLTQNLDVCKDLWEEAKQ
jgi:hypothetical protein